MQDFYVFQKINFQNFSVTWNKINRSLDLLISYPSITQTQIKHMLPTSFKFRVNSYIKTVISKTQENSRLKTRYLKGITTEQLLIISIIKYYPPSPFIYSALKNKNQTHTFLFCFHFIFFPDQTLQIKINFYFAFSYAFFYFQQLYSKLKNSKRKEILSQIHRGCFSPKLDVVVVEC